MLSWKFNYESAILLRILQVKEIVSNLSPKKCHVFILILVSLFHTLFFLHLRISLASKQDITPLPGHTLLLSWSPLLFTGQAEYSDPH